jgi:hypothetical protein
MKKGHQPLLMAHPAIKIVGHQVDFFRMPMAIKLVTSAINSMIELLCKMFC